MRPEEDLQKVHQRRKNRESLLETLESIVVAFVLAFIFRAFIVEAFVIPTGSMAPTLYGAHAEFKCECGYEFAVGVEGRLVRAPVCPNCFLEQTVPERTTVFSGDRLLVLKYLYDFQPPQRWDVIVFHNPNDPSQNYIKRLIALPDETLELVDGNITINGRIAHKTDVAQEALWMVVHDTRNRPTRRGWEPRWLADSEWKVRDAGYVLEKVPEGPKAAWLTYRHRNGQGRPANITDFYAYNTGGSDSRTLPVVVTDLGLHSRVTVMSPASVVVAEMRAYKDRFKFELSSKGSDQPCRIWINDKLVAHGAGGALPVGRAADIEVANVDHKVMLLVDGARVARETAFETTPEGDVTYEPRHLTQEERDRYNDPPDEDLRHMAAEVRIGVRGGPAKFAYLRLDRDVYYLNEDIHGGRIVQEPGRASQGNPFHLEAGEYFVCGDNSPKSFDSRLWGLDRPVVPERNLVGKAFFVYWPSAGWRYGIPVAPDPTGWRLVH